MIGHNMYLYCANNPVNFCDQSGAFLVTTFKAIANNNPAAIPTIKNGPSLPAVAKSNNTSNAVNNTTGNSGSSPASPSNNNITYQAPSISARDISNILLSTANRKPGKEPNSSWPELPGNLGKKPKWNPKGYYEGKYGETTWDSHSHGSGVDRGDGPQDGHWDTEFGGRFRRDGSELILTGIVLTGIIWGISIYTAPATGGGSLVFLGI